MADGDVVVAGVGMMTAVGLTAKETAASVRARTMRFVQTPIYDRRFEPFTLAEVIEDGLPDLDDAVAAEPGVTWRESRMLRLAAMPMVECLASAGPNAGPIALFLSLPETETTIPLDGAKLLARLSLQTDAAFDAGQSDASFRGRAGGLIAIGKACARIRERKSEFALAGGVDTYRDLYVLGTLDRDQRIKSSGTLDGAIPGEGAGFVLLAERRAAARAGIAPLAVISPVAEGFEEGHLGSEKPYRGEGLAVTFAKLFDAARPSEPIREVWSSMNGESFWAKEWGVSFLRQRDRFAPEQSIRHPADSFGDTGAACGPILVGLAALGVVEGYRPGPSLVYASSDGGARAALILAAAAEG